MQAAARWVGSAPALAIHHCLPSNKNLTEAVGNRANLELRCRTGTKVSGLHRLQHRMVGKERRSSMPLSGQVRATSDVAAVETGENASLLNLFHRDWFFVLARIQLVRMHLCSYSVAITPLICLLKI